jgi:hypothetical protein
MTIPASKQNSCATIGIAEGKNGETRFAAKVCLLNSVSKL